MLLQLFITFSKQIQVLYWNEDCFVSNIGYRNGMMAKESGILTKPAAVLLNVLIISVVILWLRLVHTVIVAHNSKMFCRKRWQLLLSMQPH